MKIFERVIEGRVRKIVSTDKMQFEFKAERSKTDAFFIVRQLQDKYPAKINFFRRRHLMGCIGRWFGGH